MPPKSKTFIIASDHYFPEIVGGAEIIAKLQADLLKLKGQDVTVLTSVYEYVQLTDADYTVNRQRSGTQKHAQAIIQKISRDSQVQGLDTSIIFHNIKYFGHEILLVNLPQAKKIVWIHDFYYLCELGIGIADPNSDDCLNHDRCNCINNSVENFLERESKLYSLSKVDCLIAPSKYLASVFNKITGQIIRDVSNSNFLDLNNTHAFDHKSYCKNPESHLQILWTGYHGWHKGITDAVNLIHSFQNKNDWCFTILGDGELNYKFVELQRDLGSYRIHLIGKVTPETSYEHIRSCDLLLHPSIWAENEPISILIAKEFNKYIAGYKIGGTAELLLDYPRGITSARGNWEELSKKITRLLENKSHAESRDNLNLIKQKRNSFDLTTIGDENFSRIYVDAIWLTGETSSWNNWTFEIHHKWRLFRPNELHILEDSESLRGLVLAGYGFSMRLVRIAVALGVPIFAPRNLQLDIDLHSYVYRFSNLDQLVWLIEKGIPTKDLGISLTNINLNNSSFIRKGDFGWHE